ncbi:NTE family protein [Pullulanibacillus pueri]|uniref:Esterase n=1 Tax=Pullulanibacillus pueri TaxID=1437324 RepID=A0A8J2ZRI4_9BACL|nr:patatin-like phospholipase family protein [Pullulanibacillus pueri]MBM7680115.1 NTE family protein [Pullulanibacillus pueri]GGH74433.1 esterase [Pullulanibacillus pueri]
MAKPKIGLALGSGGAKGFAHVGVLKVLSEAGVPIDFMAGSSMGALACALYACGHDWKVMAKMATTFRRKHFVDWTLPKMGLVSGRKVGNLIRVLTHNKRFEDCKIPIKIVATDLISGKHVIFDSGYLYEAVRASISIPGIFVPVKKDGKILVDGGVIDRVPVTVVKEMGADITIAVDVASYYGKSDIHSIYDVIMSSIDIMQQQIVTLQEPSADIVIKPPIGQYRTELKVWESMEKIIEIGEATARRQLPDIQQLIKAWKERS